jgi:hypothetical protein
MAIAGLHLARPHRARSIVLAIVSAVIFVAALLEGAREHKDARVAQEQQQSIQKGLDKIQSALNAGVATPDQTLAAAAAKLIDQGKEIKSLQDKVSGITHPANGLYLGDTIVAQIAGQAIRSGNEFIFQLLVSGDKEFDFNRPYAFQDMTIRCTPPGVFGGAGSFGVMSYRYPNVHCTIQ